MNLSSLCGKRVAFLLLAAAVARPPVLPAQQDAAAIRAADSAWARAVEARSVEQVVAFYDQDAMTAGGAMFPACGLVAIRAGWASVFSQPDWRLTWQVDSIAVAPSGTIAYSTGQWQQLSPTPLSGTYLAVWRKGPDGTWKLLLDAAW